MSVYKDPKEIVKALRDAAQDYEDSERSPVTGISTYAKESTAEWAAANLIERQIETIAHFEAMRDGLVDICWDMEHLLSIQAEEKDA